MLPSRARGGPGAEGSLGQQQPTEWTPWGVFVPHQRLFRQYPYDGAVSQVAESSPGAWYTPPTFFQMIGVQDGFLLPHQQVPAPGRSFQGTPVVYANAAFVNPFPTVAPPTPTLPLPAAWPGRL